MSEDSTSEPTYEALQDEHAVAKAVLADLNEQVTQGISDPEKLLEMAATMQNAKAAIGVAGGKVVQGWQRERIAEWVKAGVDLFEEFELEFPELADDYRLNANFYNVTNDEGHVELKTIAAFSDRKTVIGGRVTGTSNGNGRGSVQEHANPWDASKPFTGKQDIIVTAGPNNIGVRGKLNSLLTACGLTAPNKTVSYPSGLKLFEDAGYTLEPAA